VGGAPDGVLKMCGRGGGVAGCSQRKKTGQGEELGSRRGFHFRPWGKGGELKKKKRELLGVCRKAIQIHASGERKSDVGNV